VIVPDNLPEIKQLIRETDPSAASNLADGLWIKYRASNDWGFKVWDNTIASLRQVPSMIEDLDARQTCANRYASFLWKVDQHLQNGLDADILRWFDSSGKAEIIDSGPEAWDVFVAVLLCLSASGGLKITTVLEGLVYPAWSMGGIGGLPDEYLAAANSLCFDLLLREDAGGRVLPPKDLFEVQRLRTRRQAVYEEPHFSVLITSIPALISLEINPEIPEHLRVESTGLRFRLCQDPGFRQGAYRDLNLIRDAFENSPFLMDQGTYSDDLCKREIAGLKMILYDSTDGQLLLKVFPRVFSLKTHRYESLRVARGQIIAKSVEDCSDNYTDAVASKTTRSCTWPGLDHRNRIHKSQQTIFYSLSSHEYSRRGVLRCGDGQRCRPDSRIKGVYVFLYPTV
jgi:mediator of RNA polymerase II transcription subunit 12